MATSSLFLCTIGPVQSFISQARKTRDLYAASKLLSDLTWVGVQAFLQQQGKMIFPAVVDPQHLPAALPNRFLGELSQTNAQTLHDVGQAVEKAIRDYFRQQAGQVIAALFDPMPEETAWTPQIDAHLEVFWLFVPVAADTPAAYQAAHDEINQLAGAIKNERRFAQLAERGRKCLLDGERNALFYRPTESETGQDGLPALLPHNAPVFKVTRAGYHNLYPGEALSAVSLFKRFYSGADFPATAEVATFATLHVLRNTPAWQAYRGWFTNNWDEQLLYIDNLHETYLRKQGHHLLIPRLPELRQQHQRLVAACRQQHLRLGKYYALLVFDGDGAGEWIAGHHLPAGQDLRRFHQTIAETLSHYARLARQYLRPPLGRTVFAGGDDFIGFINLDHLFTVLAHLRQLFAERVSGPLSTQFGITQPFTFSAGVAIAHYKEPLSEVIKAARAAEHSSKDYPGKNALTLSIIRHSDHLGSSAITLPWAFQPENGSASAATGVATLQTIVSLLQHRILPGQRQLPLFSNTFIKKLHQTFRELGETPDREILFPLLPYYLKRSYLGPIDQKEQRVDEMMAALETLWTILSPVAFASALDCLDFISNHLNPLPLHA